MHAMLIPIVATILFGAIGLILTVYGASSYDDAIMLIGVLCLFCAVAIGIFTPLFAEPADGKVTSMTITTAPLEITVTAPAVTTTVQPQRAVTTTPTITVTATNKKE